MTETTSMTSPRSNVFPIQGSWSIVLRDLGIDPRVVLRRAELPEDLFSRRGISLTPPEYFRLWAAIEHESKDPLFSLHLGQVLTTEAFHPPIFAALCSSNYAVAIRRLSHFKRLVAPIELQVDDDAHSLSVTVEWLDRTVDVPVSVAIFELVFFVQLARLATREPIVPLAVQTPQPPRLLDEYERFFGVKVERAEYHRVTFSRVDALRPFLTANEAMWNTFEPALRRRLADLDASATFGERVRSALLEGLPSGESSMEEIASTLAVSKRTLQRRLRDEDTSFQRVLNATREDLARHYLSKTTLSGAEISYLVGFEDPNSFFRAFHTWTGQTTEQVRLANAR